MHSSPKSLLIRQVALAAALAVGAAGPAQAYIDPGTGSMLLQVIGAGIAGGIFYFRELRIKVMSLFSRDQTPADDAASEPPPGDSPR
jgi:hypothetical protein